MLRDTRALAALASVALHVSVTWGVWAAWWHPRVLPAGAAGAAPPLKVRQLTVRGEHGSNVGQVTLAIPDQPADTASPAASAPDDAQSNSASGNLPAYWPRKLLDVGPAPTSSVILPTPTDQDPSPPGHAILELFIDATGRVDHIDILEAQAPIEFVDAAKAIFLLTPFTPGLKDQTPVPSRIKIEVRYE